MQSTAHKRRKSGDVTSAQCWCGLSCPADLCCAPMLSGAVKAADAVALMRSRYSAYVTENAEYLLRTWHPRTRPASIEFDPDRQWLGLKVYSHDQGQPGDKRGSVEFAARFKIHGRGHRLRERSQFVFEQNSWLYLEGELSE